MKQNRKILRQNLKRNMINIMRMIGLGGKPNLESMRISRIALVIIVVCLFNIGCRVNINEEKTEKVFCYEHNTDKFRDTCVNFDFVYEYKNECFTHVYYNMQTNLLHIKIIIDFDNPESFKYIFKGDSLSLDFCSKKTFIIESEEVNVYLFCLIDDNATDSVLKIFWNEDYGILLQYNPYSKNQMVLRDQKTNAILEKLIIDSIFFKYGGNPPPPPM